MPGVEQLAEVLPQILCRHEKVGVGQTAWGGAFVKSVKLIGKTNLREKKGKEVPLFFLVDVILYGLDPILNHETYLPTWEGICLELFSNDGQS